MATINNGESGSSVRTKLNDIINKVEGVTSINNDIDVTGTVTADGLTVEGAVAGLANFYRASANANFGAITFKDTTNTNTNAQIGWNSNELRLEGTNSVRQVTGGLNRMLISSGGDISFYEDTGTTPKFFWDASAESLGIGTTNAAYDLTVQGASNLSTIGTNSGALRLRADGAWSMQFYTDSSEVMRITAAGNVGIGTTSPSFSIGQGLHIDSGGYTAINLQKGTSGGGGHIIDFTDASNTTQYRIGTNFSSGGENLLFAYGSTPTVGMTLNSSGNVGIGTSSPSRTLTVSRDSSSSIVGSFISANNQAAITLRGSATTSDTAVRLAAEGNELLAYAGGAEAMRIDSNGNTTFKANNSSVGPIVTLENTAAAVNGQAWGSIHFNSNDTSTNASGTRASIAGTSTSFNGDGNLVFSTAPSNGSNAERMRLDASGNLLVGKTAINTNVVGVEFKPAGQVLSTADGTNPLFLNRKTSDGEIVRIAKDGTTVGSIGASGGEAYIGSGDTGVLFISGSDAITPHNTTTNGARSGSIDIGTSSRLFKDLYLSGGVYLGGIVAANKLDDYETGTWTPTTGGDATGALSAASGKYVKVGTFVHIYCVFDVSTDFSSGNIGGLPFAVLPNSVISGVYGGGTAITSSTPQTFSFNDAERINFTSNPNTTNNVYRLSFSYITA